METGLKSRSLALTGEFLSPSPAARHSANAAWIRGGTDRGGPAAGRRNSGACHKPRQGGWAAGSARLKMAEAVLSFPRAAQRAWIGPENEG